MAKSMLWQRALRAAFFLRFVSTALVVQAALVQQACRGRTFEFSAKGDDAIAAATTAQINAAFRKYVQPEALALVYAGDFTKP